jgi:hypothetical protein
MAQPEIAVEHPGQLISRKKSLYNTVCGVENSGKGVIDSEDNT